MIVTTPGSALLTTPQSTDPRAGACPPPTFPIALFVTKPRTVALPTSMMYPWSSLLSTAATTRSPGPNRRGPSTLCGARDRVTDHLPLSDWMTDTTATAITSPSL